MLSTGFDCVNARSTPTSISKTPTNEAPPISFFQVLKVPCAMLLTKAIFVVISVSEARALFHIGQHIQAIILFHVVDH